MHAGSKLRLSWFFCLVALAGLPVADAADRFTASGITEPIYDVTVGAPAAGIVSRRLFDEGAVVQAGQVLLELDKRFEELEAERRQLVAAQRKTDFEATRLLFEKTKGVSKEELEKREVEYKVAAVEHAMASEQLQKRLITAPLAGQIVEFYLDVGEACQPYQSVLRLVDTRQCYFVANVEARAAAHLRLHQPVRLEIDTGARPVLLEGKIVYLSPVVDAASGLLRVKALFDNPDGTVRPGVAGVMHFEALARAEAPPPVTPAAAGAR
jgi:RND family efflux transporter MFP subunit